MDSERASHILSLLQEEFPLPDQSERARDPFETLVRTVISQNTAETNTSRAFVSLLKRFDLTPETLSKASVRDVEESLKLAGLHRKKARVLKKVSRIIAKTFMGSLDFVFTLPLERAREKLIGLPGVGPKTADVVLLFSARRPTLPVDTHVNRVSKRLGLVEAEADYEETRTRLQSLFDPSHFYAAHVLLISLGRNYCRARNPLCRSCPIRLLCPSRIL